MLVAMTIIVLEVIALVFQRVERLIFDAPPRSSASHELIHRAFVDTQVGDPTKVLDLVLGLVPLPALQKVDPEVSMRFIERHVTDKTKPLVDTRLRVVAIVIRYPPGCIFHGCLPPSPE